MCHKSLCKSLIAGPRHFWFCCHSVDANLSLFFTYHFLVSLIKILPVMTQTSKANYLSKPCKFWEDVSSQCSSPHSALCLCWLQPNLYGKHWTKKITLAFKTLCWIKIKSILIIVIIKRGSISSQIMELEFLPNLKLLEAPPSEMVANSVGEQ